MSPSLLELVEAYIQSTEELLKGLNGVNSEPTYRNRHLSVAITKIEDVQDRLLRLKSELE